MNVKQLIAALSKLDNQEMEIVSGDDDGWFYGVNRVTIQNEYQGRIYEPGDKLFPKSSPCVCLE